MRRFIVLVWLVGCSSDAAGDDDQPPMDPPPVNPNDDADQGDDAATDHEECEQAMLTGNCPPNWGWLYHPGPKTTDDIEVADLGKPVCDGRGVYADSESIQSGLESSPIVGVTTLSNSQCYVVCFPRCSPTSICWAKGLDGEPCGDACTAGGLTEDECSEFVAECLGEDVSFCDDD